MRTAANFDRQPPGRSVQQYKFYDNSGGFLPSLQNILITGLPIVKEIVFNNWRNGYEDGVEPTNYIGDIFGSLGGKPDFGYVNISFLDTKATV